MFSNIITSEHVNTLLTVTIPAIVGGIGTFVMFFARRGLLDRFFNKKINCRKINPDEKNHLTNHIIFSLTNKAMKMDIPSFVKQHKKPTIHLFFLCFLVMIETLDNMLDEFVNNLPENREKSDNTDKIVNLISLFYEKVEKEFLTLDVPHEVLNDFNVFTILHSEVMMTSAEKIVAEAATYYDEVNQFLYFMWSLLRLVVDESKIKAVKFNGNIEVKLTPELLKKVRFNRYSCLLSEF